MMDDVRCSVRALEEWAKGPGTPRNHDGMVSRMAARDLIRRLADPGDAESLGVLLDLLRLHGHGEAAALAELRR